MSVACFNSVCLFVNHGTSTCILYCEWCIWCVYDNFCLLARWSFVRTVYATLCRMFPWILVAVWLSQKNRLLSTNVPTNPKEMPTSELDVVPVILSTDARICCFCSHTAWIHPVHLNCWIIPVGASSCVCECVCLHMCVCVCSVIERGRKREGKRGRLRRTLFSVFTCQSCCTEWPCSFSFASVNPTGQ